MNLTITLVNNFVKEVKRLAKKYKNISSDLKILKDELLLNPISGTELGNNCYKIRLANSSIPTGKSGGFRVIYYYIKDSNIYLLSIYSKSDIENISEEKLKEILKENEL